MPSTLTKKKVKRIEEVLTQGVNRAIVAKRFHVHPATISKIMRGEHFHQQPEDEQRRRRSQDRSRGNDAVRHYVPSPEEIARECERLRAARVEVEDDAGWEVPVFCERTLGVVFTL